MDSQRDARAALERYRLHGVKETGKEFGWGSYAAVVEVDFKGLRCAGKKIYRVLYEQGIGDLVRRFEEECKLLSDLRHPHVVQFLGIYFDPETDVPVLVMEFLPTTLAQCLDRYGVLPEEINYSILQDVGLGLRYLHERPQPIVHRDLSANNVLLTSDMRGKISDLGVAKIFHLSPAQMSRMTRGPGTPSYMPPEALAPNSRYDIKVDIFSYGVMMVHVFSGRWPLPGEAVRVSNEDELIPVSEADRREEYLNDLGHNHPLRELILRCLKNSPIRRPEVAEIVRRVSEAGAQFPPSFANAAEMLQRIQVETNEKNFLRSENETLRGRKEEVERLHLAECDRLHQLVTELEQHPKVYSRGGSSVEYTSFGASYAEVTSLGDQGGMHSHSHPTSSYDNQEFGHYQPTPVKPSSMRQDEHLLPKEHAEFQLTKEQAKLKPSVDVTSSGQGGPIASTKASMQQQQQDRDISASTGSGVAAMGTKVINVVKELATGWEWDDYKGTCRQCHQPITSPVRSRSDTFCSQDCCFTFQREHSSGETVWLCDYPGCNKPCYVEHGSHRMHDYCGRTHAQQHKEMLESSQRQQRGEGRQQDSHNSGTTQASYFKLPTSWFAKHDQKKGPIKFYNSDDPYYEFTNFYPVDIVIDGLHWPTTEHYFQAQTFVGTPFMELIRQLPRPRMAFDVSRDPRVSCWRRSDWEAVKLDVMYKVLLAKFSQNHGLKELLKGTGERKLIEHSFYDSFWGDGGDNTGQNYLGKLLMQLRGELRGGKVGIPSVVYARNGSSPGTKPRQIVEQDASNSSSFGTGGGRGDTSTPPSLGDSGGGGRFFPGGSSVGYTGFGVTSSGDQGGIHSHSHPTSSYDRHLYQPTPVKRPQCSASGCDNPVHYEPDVGMFDYCTPKCRDEHLLPKEKSDLRDSIAKEQANQFRWPWDDYKGTCRQCHQPITSPVRSRSDTFCSQDCCFTFRREHSSGETVWLCDYPGCNKPCYVEHGSHRMHDYCGRTHAQQHKEILESSQRQQRGEGRQQDSHNSGTTQASYFKLPTSLFAKHDRKKGPIKFYNSDDPYYEFTNFYPVDIVIDGLHWPTTEHYFQAQKFVGTPFVELIRQLPRPRMAFDVSRDPRVSCWRRSDWEAVKLDVMYKALLAKFSQNHGLKELLKGTGERKLIEHSFYDSFWGDGGDNTGQNYLGKLLMQLRGELRGGKVGIPSVVYARNGSSPGTKPRQIVEQDASNSSSFGTGGGRGDTSTPPSLGDSGGGGRFFPGGSSVGYTGFGVTSSGDQGGIHSHSHPTSSYDRHHYQPTPVKRPQCSASGCDNPVHYEPDVGMFDYCTPKCRDEHLLPKEKSDLRDSIAKEQANLKPSGGEKVKQKTVSVQYHWKGDAHFGVFFYGEMYKLDGAQGALVTGISVHSHAYGMLKKGDVQLLDIIVKMNRRSVTSRSVFSEEINKHKAIDMVVDRSIAIHGGEIAAEADKQKATHIFVLMNPHSFAQEDFGLTFSKRPREGIVVHGVAKANVAQLSGIMFNDVIVAYALASQEKVEELQTSYSCIAKVLEKASTTGKSVILFVKRSTDRYQ